LEFRYRAKIAEYRKDPSSFIPLEDIK
jgi:hypothetical protein